MKTYNKLPRPLPDFAIALTGFAIAALGFWTAAWPSLREDVSANANSIASTFGLGSVDVDFVLALLLSAGSIALAATIALSSYRGFHNGAWAGPKPSPDRSYGNARIISSAAHPPTSIQGVEARGEVPARSRRRRHRSLPEPPSHRAHPKRAHRRRHRIWKNDLGLGTVPNRPHRVGDARLHLHPGSQGRALFSHCAPRRKERRKGGHDRLLRFEDLRRMAAPSASHNCAKGVNGRCPDEMPAEIRILASTLIPDRHESSPIWTNAARILFSGLSAFVASSERVPDECRNLSTVAALASMPQETLQKITEELPIGSSARQQLSAVAFAPAETFGGFATNLNAALDPYADPSVSPMLSNSDYRPEDFAKGRVCLYVKFNGGSTALDALVATFVSQTLETLRRVAERECGGRLPHPVYCLFEEFAQLPKIDGMQNTSRSSVGRASGWPSWRRTAPRSNPSTAARPQRIFNNLDTTLFLASNDLKTCKHYSEALGSYTVETVQNSRTRGANTGSSTQSRTLHEARLFRPRGPCEVGLARRAPHHRPWRRLRLLVASAFKDVRRRPHRAWGRRSGCREARADEARTPRQEPQARAGLDMAGRRRGDFRRDSGCYFRSRRPAFHVTTPRLHVVDPTMGFDGFVSLHPAITALAYTRVNRRW